MQFKNKAISDIFIATEAYFVKTVCPFVLIKTLWYYVIKIY